jgi:kynureninase
MVTRSDCVALDAADRLAPHRDRFRLPEGIIYLDGNSLGPLSTSVVDGMTRAVAGEWGEGLIRSWNSAGWVDLPARVGDRIARLIGAEPGTVMVGDSTSINLYKAVDGARRLRPGRRLVVTDSGNFPTDLYVLQGVCSAAGLDLEVVAPDRVLSAICDDTAVVALTEVDYRTGRRHDMVSLTAAAHAAGAIAVWDLAHSAGAFPVELAGVGADFAVGCGYKYLNGGPGAPGFLYVAPSHRDGWRNPITGWFGHSRPFAFEPVFDPAEGIDRAAVGTPAILSMAALDAALDVFDDVDLAEVRRKSLALTDLFIDLIDEHLPELEVITPRDHSSRGSHVSLRHEDGYPIIQALIARGVIGDFRSPDILRFGFAPLYLSHLDVFEAVEHLVEVMASDEWRQPRFAMRLAVT